ncbi:hypothetical protein NL676_000578 [Syzygium grande]|nr:hypothetical protein NL676_000578 [Syzygium grande]
MSRRLEVTKDWQGRLRLSQTRDVGALPVAAWRCHHHRSLPFPSRGCEAPELAGGEADEGVKTATEVMQSEEDGGVRAKDEKEDEGKENEKKRREKNKEKNKE